MQLSHTRPIASARFDDPNLVSCAGLVPIVALAQHCALGALADEHLTVPTDKGSNAGAKVSALVAGMVAGADSIDDMRLLRHGAMGTLFDRPYAPSTLGSFLRGFTFGHVRQLDAVATRLLGQLHARTPLLAGIDGPVMVDLDDTIIEVHGYAKQGSEYGYSGVRGLNALIATVTTTAAAPVIVGQRLRKGACGSPRGAARMIGDTLATLARLRSSAEATGKPLVRMDSAFYGQPSVAAAIRGGADVSVTVRLDPKVKAAIAAIDDNAWTTIEYTDALYDQTTHRVQFSQSRRAGPGQTGGAPHPRPSPRTRSGPADLVRYLAFPRVLHHHRSGHHHRRHDPPRPRSHRTGPRRPQRLRPGPPTVRTIFGQRRLAGDGRHRVQPHPRRGNPDRTQAGQGPHRHDPPHPDHDPGADRILGPTPHPAPTARLAVGSSVEHPVQQSVSSTSADRRLTRTPLPALDTKTQQEQPDTEIGRSHTATRRFKKHNQSQLPTRTRSVHPG
jgi:Transposase DDE domain group 1